MPGKSIEQTIADAQAPHTWMPRTLGLLPLTMMGIGVTVGSGLFVLTGTAAADYAGPAITVSFMIGAAVALLVAVSYAEFAGSVPVAGSAYTYAAAALGEFCAWVIGWDLMLEMTVGAAAVSVGWSGYLEDLLGVLGIRFPATLSGPDAVLNVPAMALALALTVVLVLGIRLTARVTTVMTAVKVLAAIAFVLVGARHVDPANWSPFVPAPRASPTSGAWDTPLISVFDAQATRFGPVGVLTGGAIVFGAYTGFDIIASSAEETRQPQRAVPLAIAGTLLVCSTLYVSVSFVLTGMVRYDRIDPAAPVTGALRMVGATWTALGVATGAVVGLAAVVLVMMMGQARVFLAMSRDGLLPRWFAAVHPKRRTPQRITVVLGAGVALVAGTTPITELAELSNIGTLAAFAIVSGGVLRLRVTRPDLRRAFRVPLVPWLPLLAILACVVLALHYPLVTWARFSMWMTLGLLIRFSVARHSPTTGSGR